MKTLARRRDAIELIERLPRLQPSSVRRWGRMSAHQMVCHLVDGFRMMSGELIASPASGLMERTVIKWIALYVPLPWPSGIITRPELDQELQGTRPRDFAVDLGDLEEWIRRTPDVPRNFKGRTHPIFGPLSESAWLRWAYLHVDHHLRQFGA